MTIRTLILAIFALIISVVDSKTLRIPDFLLLSCFFALVILDIYRSGGTWFFYENLLSASVWFIIFYLVYRYSGGLGFGDVKYAALLGYALGLEKSGTAFLSTALGAILVYVIGIGFLRWEKTVKLPFAPFLSFGAMAAEFYRNSLGELLI